MDRVLNPPAVVMAVSRPEVAGDLSTSAPATTAEVQRNPTYERWRWQIFAVTWLAYFGFYLTRKSFSIAKITLGEAEWGWSKVEMSWAGGGLLAAYAIGQFLFGVMGDRYGTRKVILVGMLGSVIAAALSALSPQFWILAPLLFAQGLFQSSGWAPLAKNMGEFFSQRERGWVLGVWMTNYAAGGVAGAALAGAAAQQWGWPAAFWAPALALAGIWVVFLIGQANRPEDVGLPPIEEYHREPQSLPGDATTPPQEGSWEVVREVLKSRMVWLLAAVYFFLKPTRYLLMFWSPVYLHERLATNTADSAYLSGLFDLAGPLSVMAGGLLSDRLFSSRRIPLCVISLLASSVLLFKLDTLPASYAIYGAVLFLLGFLIYIPDSLVSGTAAIDFGTKRGASTAAGFICGVGSIAAVLGELLPGFVEQWIGQGQHVWNYVFISLAFSLLLAAVLLLPKWNALPPQAPGRGAR